jgi:hypothetical protein
MRAARGQARARVRGWAALAAAALAPVAAGCAAPQFTYVSDASAQAYFKVPYGWHQITAAELAPQLKLGAAGGGIWQIGYDAAPTPSAVHALSPAAPQPFAFALVLPVNPAAHKAVTVNFLRDAIMPVTNAGRQAYAAQGFSVAGFRLLSDTVVSAGHGVRGVRDIFDYTSRSGYTDTFDKVALTNAGHSQVYVLLVHCLASCYRQHQKEIETVMRSFTVGNS